MYISHCVSYICAIYFIEWRGKEEIPILSGPKVGLFSYLGMIVKTQKNNLNAVSKHHKKTLNTEKCMCTI